MDWSDGDPRREAFLRFTEAAIRMRCELSPLRAERFLHGEPAWRDGPANVRWLRPDGAAMRAEDWSNPHAKAVGVALADATRTEVLLLVNAHHEPVEFSAPEPAGGRAWRLRLDSADGRIDPPSAIAEPGRPLAAPARGLLLFDAI